MRLVLAWRIPLRAPRTLSCGVFVPLYFASRRSALGIAHYFCLHFRWGSLGLWVLFNLRACYPALDVRWG